MKTITIALLGLSVAIAAGPDPEGFKLWTASQLPKWDQTLATKGEGENVTIERLGQFGSHNMILIHRDGSGHVEMHEKLTDIYFVQGGEATLVIGGTIVDQTTLSPGEIRGKALNGSDERKMVAGDVVNIPPGLPHQIKVAPGKKVSYFTMKVAAK